jgi:transposase
LEDLQQAEPAEDAAAVESSSTEPSPDASAAKAKRRRPLPGHLPRKTQTHVPKHSACPDCGGELRKLGEDVSEVLEYVSACFEVIRHVRPKLSCGCCERIVQAPAPSRPIARGLAGPGSLAHVLISKYADHLPLYRQCEIYARQGVELERSTLADWVGGSSELLDPLVEALRRYVMAAGKLHADDTPVPVLAPGNGKTRPGVCGRMFAMIGRRVMRRHRRCGLRTHRTARVNIPSDICSRFGVHCKPMPTPDSISFIKKKMAG